MKEVFERMNAHIVPDESLSSAVLDKVLSPVKPARRFRPLVAVAAVLVLMILATPVMAGRIPMVNDLLYTVSPELAEHFAPVQLSDSDNGITLEVMAAKITDSAAEFVIKVEGEALAGKIVGPQLTIRDYNRTTRISGESLNDYEGLHEDREKGIWYYQYVVTYRDGTPVTKILRDNITVELPLIYLDEEGAEGGLEIPIIFTDYEQMLVKHDRALYDYGFKGFGWSYKDGAQEEYMLMTPGESVYDVTDKLALTGAAYIDGKLHIQVAGKDQTVNNRSAWFHWPPHFVDEQGNTVQALYRNNFTIEDEGHEIRYEECVYDIPENELHRYTLRVKTMENDVIFTDCKVTFRISDLDYTTE